MKVKLTTNTRGSNGKRRVRSSPRSRPLATASWRTSTAVLISRSAVPRVRSLVAGKRANSVRVFLIEDNRLLRDGLVGMLSANGLKVEATARSGAEALRQVGRLQPDLILLDSALGDRDSLRLVASVRKLSPSARAQCFSRTTW